MSHIERSVFCFDMKRQLLNILWWIIYLCA